MEKKVILLHLLLYKLLKNLDFNALNQSFNRIQKILRLNLSENNNLY